LEFEEGRGVIYTRTGRPFFNHKTMNSNCSPGVSSALESTGLYSELNSDWVVLDCELMPGRQRLRTWWQQQYAAVGAAGIASMSKAIETVAEGCKRLPSWLLGWKICNDDKRWSDGMWMHTDAIAGRLMDFQV